MEYDQAARDDRRGWLRKLALGAAGGLVGAQALTASVLEVASLVRRHSRAEPEPPREPYGPGRIGSSAFKLYGRGEELYDDMLAAMDAAQETIYFETYLWKGDEVAQRFVRAMLAKARQGVDVRLIYDRFGNLVVPARKKAIPAPIHTLVYSGLTQPWRAVDPRSYALDHRKLLVVDGRVAFTGGYNIGSHYTGKWRDTHIRVEGSIAATVALAFATFWNQHVGEDGPHISRRYPTRFDPFIEVQVNDAATLSFPIRDMYLRAFSLAERRIRLTSAYFAPDQALVAALLDAAARGLDVQILVPWVSNHVVMDWLARGYFTDLLQAGVRIHGYEGMIHAKTCTVDGIWSTVGTANLDRLSQVGNHELNLEIVSEELAGQLETMFERDVRASREIRAEEWQRRPFYARLGELTLEPLRAVM